MRRTKFPMSPEMKAAIEIREAMEAAERAEATKPRIGPKHPPIILPEAPNTMGY